ncbi:hypothetical protein [Nocardia thraciensis]
MAVQSDIRIALAQSVVAWAVILIAFLAQKQKRPEERKQHSDRIADSSSSAGAHSNDD